MSDRDGPAPPDAATDAMLDAIIAGLSNSQKHVIRVGATYSSAQRSRLIDKGLADPGCRGQPPLPRRPDSLSRRYGLPLTTLGLAVRARLLR